MAKQVYMHFDTLENGKSVWLIPMPDGEIKQIPTSIARTISSDEMEIRIALDQTTINTILNVQGRGLEVVMLQGQGCKTIFHLDGTQTIYDRGRVIKQGQVFNLKEKKVEAN